jgi:hypothetical protein
VASLFNIVVGPDRDRFDLILRPNDVF